MKIVVLCPHFAPDTAPTGSVMTGIVDELAARGHEIHVVTSLPWYRDHAIAPGWSGRWWRTESTDWGSVTRVHPFPGDDRRRLLRRALGFGGFTALAGVAALRVGPRRRVEAVLAMSPPLTLGPVGVWVARLRSARAVFNIQDVFPDAAVRTGAITSPRVIALAEWLERRTYTAADAVTVLSDDLATNVRTKLARVRRADTDVVVIPNFVDAERVRVDIARAPGRAGAATAYLDEFAPGDAPVVMYAGNCGFSQSLDMMVTAAERLPEVRFIINGNGAARPDLDRAASRLANLTTVDYQPMERLGEVLASADVHVVPLRRGLGDVSVPSKTYTVLAAGRAVLAAIDDDTEVARIIASTDAGRRVPPDDVDAFCAAIAEMLADPDALVAMGERGRAWVIENASPAAVGRAYDEVLAPDR